MSPTCTLTRDRDGLGHPRLGDDQLLSLPSTLELGRGQVAQGRVDVFVHVHIVQKTADLTIASW
jgi:hypothetical protein